MSINTCSGAISLSRELENQAATFYQELSQRFEKNKDLFIAFCQRERSSLSSRLSAPTMA